MFPKFLTPKELASEMGVSPRTVYEWLRKDKVPGAFKFGNAGVWFINSKIFLRHLEYLSTDDCPNDEFSEFSDDHGII